MHQKLIYFLFFVITIILIGCEKSYDFNTKISKSEPYLIKSNQGIVLSGKVASVSTGEIIVRTLSGKDIIKTQTSRGESLGDSKGNDASITEFSFSIPEAYGKEPIVLVWSSELFGSAITHFNSEVSSDKIFTGSLMAIYIPTDGRTNLNITPITTLVAHLATNKSMEGSDLIIKRNAAIDKLSHLGMIDVSHWHDITNTYFNLDAITFRIQDLGGIQQWLDTIETNIIDGELSEYMSAGFPKAYGGLRAVGIEKYISVIPGKQITIMPEPEGLAEGTKWQIKLYNTPNWISIENNTIKITPDAVQDPGILNFEVELVVDGFMLGRRVAVELEVLKMTILLQGQLGVSGGKIESKLKDISLEAQPGILKQTHDFTYLAGMNKRGELYSTFNTSPQLLPDEAAQLNLREPDTDKILVNYLKK